MNSIFLGHAIIVIVDPNSLMNREFYKPLQENTQSTYWPQRMFTLNSLIFPIRI